MPNSTSPLAFSTPEMLALAALLTASGTAFWLRLAPVVRKILAAKPDADFHLMPVGKRIRDFVWEVLLQGKVIRERPLPGIAHAFVFWGFCAFALVTLNHLASGFGLGFLDVRGAYSIFAALFAILVSISITGLFVRRFVVQPRWLGEVSPESGVIAGLILTLMATYLAAFWMGSGSGSGAAKSIWWAHTLTLALFLPLIPHTKHLHLVLSPVTIFLSRGDFAHIPPLAGDEDFGLDTGKDLTQIVALQAYSCVECGRCSQHCPATNTGKLLDPKKIALGVRDYLNDAGPGSETPLLGVHLSQEAVFQCTTCGACEFQCPVGIEHVPILVDCAAARPTPANGKTNTASSSFWHWNATATRSASAPPNATNSSPRSSSPSSTARRNTASGWAAWEPSILAAARSSDLLRR